MSDGTGGGGETKEARTELWTGEEEEEEEKVGARERRGVMFGGGERDGEMEQSE